MQINQLITQGSVDREREIHYVHWASKTYEDESVFMIWSEPNAEDAAALALQRTQ